MKVLVVGGGAVGMVYAAHLKRSGAHVALYVRPHRAEELRRGTTLYRMRSFRRPVVETFVPDDVFTSPETVASEAWDQIWLCVPTDALTGDWLDHLLGAIGDATVVSCQPGVSVKERLSALVHPDRIVLGLVGMISYQAPLPGEPLDPGVAFMFPPLVKNRFSGHPDRVDPVVAALRRGGCPARVDRDARRALAFSSSILMPHVIALEGAGWSFEEMRHGPWLALAARASREALDVTGRALGAPAPRSAHFVQPFLVRVVLMLLPWVVPFDLQQYLRHHFTKVGDQSRLLMRDYTRTAEERAIDAQALRELSERVFA